MHCRCCIGHWMRRRMEDSSVAFTSQSVCQLGPSLLHRCSFVSRHVFLLLLLAFCYGPRCCKCNCSVVLLRCYIVKCLHHRNNLFHKYFMAMIQIFDTLDLLTKHQYWYFLSPIHSFPITRELAFKIGCIPITTLLGTCVTTGGICH